MCPPLKPKAPMHPLLDNSLYNSLYVKCVTIMTHDVLSSNRSYIICTNCYNPVTYNRVLTRFSHVFQYGAVPTERCKLCHKPCCESRPLYECTRCVWAYHRFKHKIARANREDTFRRLVGLSVNSTNLDVEYGIAERRNDIDDRETLAESLSN